MGVTGLWRLVEPAGKPVPIETLENKVLAVDISIWLHQMVKGYQDAKGAPLPNAHLMGLFQRLCKLLYFRIKPVFVFDGGFPDLKKETIAKRQDHKAKYNSESERIKRELALLLSKKTAVSTLLGKQISPSKQQPTSNNDDLFKLPALPQREESESESEDERNSSNSSVDLHTVDIESDNFKNLPIKEKYDILLDLKETRKQNSWGKLEELPKQSDNFSDFQMQRLLKRRKVQECLQETEKEMGDSGMSLNDLECLLNEEGIDTKIDTLPTRRIASNVTSRFLLIKDVKKAILDAKKRQEQDEYNAGPSTATVKKIEEKPAKVDELEEDLQKAIKMSLECIYEPNTSTVSKTDDSWTSCMTDTDSDYSRTDSEEDDGFEQPDMSCAKAYIMQYSDFTHRAIDEIVTEKKAGKRKYKVPKVDKIIEDINKEKSVIVDNVELSSSDDDSNRNKITASKQIHKQIELNMLSNPSEKNIDEINDTCDKNDNSLNTTQTSIVCIENPVLGTITIDTTDTSVEDMTTIEQQPKEIVVQKESILSDCDFHKATSSNEESSNSDNDFEEVPEIKSNENKAVVEDMTTIEQQPKEIVVKKESILSDCAFHKATSSNEESSNSDNDFEEVPEIKSNENRAVVELTLKMDEIPDDNDIFADVFLHNKEENINQIAPASGEISCESTRNPKVDFKIIQTNLNDSNAEKTKNIPNTIISEVAKIKESADKTNIIGDLSNNSIPTTEINKQVITKKTDAGKQENHNASTHLSLEPTNPSNVPKDVSTEILNNMVEEIQDQEQDLIQEKGRLDRVGRNITEQMTKEAQELLQIFGIPYIVAPMEAEAQCAFLETAKLTDGTITDDSDIWLFGGRTVYKNFFNQKKHVLQFQAERIEKSFNLSREQLVLLALLVGSDYTTGVTGVGPVTAMEILASFPFNKRQVLNEATKQSQYAQIIKGLQEFKLWVKAGKRTDNTSLKKKLKNVTLSEDFPSIRVVQAYLEPNVEKSEDKFTWGQLDITILRDYTKTKFGWSQSKLDEIIMPVLKRLVERKSQKSMQDFFKRKIEFQSLEDQMSKRVKAAVQKMDLEGSAASLQAETEKVNQKAKTTKRKVAKQNIKSKIVPSASKHKKYDEANVLLEQGVKVVSLANDNKSEFEIRIHKTSNYQETIPQREKERRNLLENKLKAIEMFRKTQIDKKRKTVKRKVLKPKEKAELSESDSD